MSRAIIRSAITGDASEFKKSLQSAEAMAGQSAKTMAGKFAGIGGSMRAGIGRALSIGALAGGVKSALDMRGNVMEASDAIRNMADETGISVEKMQALTIEAEKQGVPINRLLSTFAAMREMMDKLQAEGSDLETELQFAAAGLNLQEIMRAGMDSADLFDLLASQLKEVEGNARATDAIFKIMGGGARTRRLEGFLKNWGGEGGQAIVDRMKEAGMIISEDVVNQLAELEAQQVERRAAGRVAAAETVVLQGPAAQGFQNLISDGMSQGLATTINQKLAPLAKGLGESITKLQISFEKFAGTGGLKNEPQGGIY